MGAWWPPRSSTPTWSSNSTRRVRFPSASAIALLKTEWTDEMARAYVSLIQSNYGRSRHGNFEATIMIRSRSVRQMPLLGDGCAGELSVRCSRLLDA
jgi:hypothetical protein